MKYEIKLKLNKKERDSLRAIMNGVVFEGQVVKQELINLIREKKTKVNNDITILKEALKNTNRNIRLAKKIIKKLRKDDE